MSLPVLINELIQDYVSKFIKKISNVYNIEENELKKLLDSDETPKKSTRPLEIQISNAPSPSSSPVSVKSKEMSNLEKKTKKELVLLCKEKKLKCTGTKDILIDILLGKNTNTAKTKASSPSNQLSLKKDVIQIKKNKFGNYTHDESQFVFDTVNNKAIGKQNTNGSIDSFTCEDIENCNKFKFSYDIPLNLDSKNKEDESMLLKDIMSDSDSIEELIEEYEDFEENDD